MKEKMRRTNFEKFCNDYAIKFLSDPDFRCMSLEERGLYTQICFWLNVCITVSHRADGIFDERLMAGKFNLRLRTFRRVFNKIKFKFKIENHNGIAFISLKDNL